MKRNPFIVAALEEMQQEAAEKAETGIAVDTPADGKIPQGDGAPPVVETNIDQEVDAVAALMEKNSELAVENIEMQEEIFDNDVEVVEEASDSVQQNLEEAVACGAALEELAHLANLTAKSGQANQASVAALAFAMEQIFERMHLDSPLPALEEDVTDVEPKEQAKNIGEKAADMAKKIGKMLMDGVMKIIDWIIAFFEQVFTDTQKIGQKAYELSKKVGDLPKGAKITDARFIKSLRLVKDGGSAEQQYLEYDRFVRTALLGFFGDAFISGMQVMQKSIASGQSDGTAGGLEAMQTFIDASRKAIFTESEANGAAVDVDKRATVNVTPAVVGGMQLYLAYADRVEKPEDVVLQVAKVSTGPALSEETEIDVVSQQAAKKLLNSVQDWMHAHPKLKNNIKEAKRILKGGGEWVLQGDGYGRVELQYRHIFVSEFLKMFAKFGTMAMPQLILQNIRNAKSFNAYVEKSLATVTEAQKATDANGQQLRLAA